MNWFKEQIQAYKKNKYIRKNRWYDLDMGDVVEINGKRYMYFMLDQNGGPGKPGEAEPMFTTEEPEFPSKFFYMRDINDPRFPEDVFGEGKMSRGFDGKSMVGFINTSDYTKVGHITAEEWNNKVSEVNKQLVQTAQ